MHAKVKEVLTGILDRFKTDDIPQIRSYAP